MGRLTKRLQGRCFCYTAGFKGKGRDADEPRSLTRGRRRTALRGCRPEALGRAPGTETTPY